MGSALSLRDVANKLQRCLRITVGTRQRKTSVIDALSRGFSMSQKYIFHRPGRNSTSGNRRLFSFAWQTVLDKSGL